LVLKLQPAGSETAADARIGELRAENYGDGEERPPKLAFSFTPATAIDAQSILRYVAQCSKFLRFDQSESMTLWQLKQALLETYCQR
jgi:hypothetical protein